MGKKGGSSAPPPPDPNVVSAAQTKSNQETASYNAGLSHVDQYTPYGNLTYTQVGNNADGSPHYKSNINFTPTGQSIFDQQQQQQKTISDIANGYGGQIKTQMGTPFDTSSLPAMRTSANGNGIGIQSSLDYSKLSGIPTSSADFASAGQQAQNAVMSRTRPELDHQQQALDNKLANQGIMPGSDAYTYAQKIQGQNANDATQQAVLAGNQQQNALYAQALASRQQGQSEANAQGAYHDSAQQQAYGQNFSNAQLNNSALAQQLQQNMAIRELPLNEYNALNSSSQIQTPTFGSANPVAMAPTDVSGNFYNAYRGLQDGYNQGVGSNNAMMSGLFNMGGQLGAAYISSGGSGGGE